METQVDSTELNVARAPTMDERPELLDAMVRAARGQPGNYRPGPYWRGKTRSAVRQIKRHGLADFRGEGSSIGASYADTSYTDVRTELGRPTRRPLQFVLERVFPFSRMMDAQVELTRAYSRDASALMAGRMAESAEAQALLAKYRMPYSLLGGCVSAARCGEDTVAVHYLRGLQLIDRVSRLVRLDSARSVFEIGGGFGANVHLLVEAFPGVRKVVYLDVPPNLYVGTCYLRTLYGNAVRDFTETRTLDRISFREDDSLEIIAICPWQIETLDVQVDVFWNASSFVEMPQSVVENYAARVLALPGADATSIVLATYGGEHASTLDPAALPRAFPGRAFIAEQFWMLGWPNDARVDPEADAAWEWFLSVSAPSEPPS